MPRPGLGTAFGGDYTFVYQYANESAASHNGLSGIFRIFGSWTILGREGSKNTGTLVWKGETRNRIGRGNTPFQLGFDAGSTLPTAGPFNNNGWMLTNMFWYQRLFEGRFAFIVGQVDPTDYVDVYALTNPWSGFMNLAFSTNPTMRIS